MIDQNKERIEKLDKELGNELEKSLESLGSSYLHYLQNLLVTTGLLQISLKNYLIHLNKLS